MKKNNHGRQLNTKCGKTANAGFSLVELLIAVTILAIIVIPLLHLFVTSTRINVKSRQTLRATTVAQDIMEGLKAYTLDEVRTQFSLPDGSFSSSYFYPTEGFYIVNSNMIQGGVREIKELEPWLDDQGKVINSDDPDNEIYYFGIENLKMQGGEYDALIRLDASTYTEAKAKDETHDSDATHDSVFNGTFYAQTNSVSETSGDSERDSSYHESSSLETEALEKIKDKIANKIPSEGGELPDYWEEIKTWEVPDHLSPLDEPGKWPELTKRTIEVVLEPNKDDFGNLQKDDEGNPECKATITFTYEATYDSQPYTTEVPKGSTRDIFDGITRTFSSGNFYLFYYPFYKTGVAVDNIKFTVKDAATLFDKDQPLLKSITLAKQVRSDVDITNNVIGSVMTDHELNIAESGYRAVVDMSGVGSSIETSLLFRTNIETNLSRETKTDNPRDRELGLNQINYQGDFTNPSAKIKQTDMTGDNVSDKVTDVIYDIEITVYKTGAAQHFGEPNFEEMPEVQRLAKITNLE